MEEKIQAAFCQLLQLPGIYKTLGLTAGHVKVLRHQVRNGRAISLEKQIKLLKRSGWQLPEQSSGNSDAELLDLVKFCQQAKPAAWNFGPAYLVEKWKATR